MSGMRVAGNATGMDINQIVDDLMTAEREPLNKMEQDKTSIEWERDAYRDVNKDFLELDNLALDMKLDRTFQSKEASSSGAAVSAEAGSEAGEGRYDVEVTQLASAAYNISENKLSPSEEEKIDPDGAVSEQFPDWTNDGSFTITTSEGDETFEIEDADSLNDVLRDISDAGIGVRAFYDESADKVMMERSETGNRMEGNEIQFSGDGAGFLEDTLGLNNERGGEDAEFNYGDEDFKVTSHDNNYSINGLDLTFNEVGSSTVNVTNNVDGAVEKITDFVDKYNDIIEGLGEKLNERKNRDYPPLTEEQKDEMEDDEIEKWEEQAKKGLLQNDSVISGALSQMRNSWYSNVENNGDFEHLSEIGIDTSSDYRERGKLEVDENKLRDALSQDADSVKKLFANDGEGNSKGIVRQIEDTIANTRQSIERKAGKETSLNQSFTLGRDIVDLEERMLNFEDKLTTVENRYWDQFGAMEEAIQEMNSQSAYIQQNFGGGMM
ncbi:flagellar hook-associated protein 2 [Halobacillus sp. Marseille-P3879]|uniref:flagellar hook-associated protein 2 n=1 Tax=Halobacillus sp. Marseille-P3879 TaxID=2045014 RepID=UPI000C7AF07D|nr:flagellar hook-associated protein 2 [Halobacillus sp. Marseille-P3879]